MKRTLRGLESIPFEEYDAVAKSLFDPSDEAEGEILGNEIELPEIQDNGLVVTVWQSTGAIADGGAVAGKIQQSDDGDTWEDVVSFTDAGANTFEAKRITLTKKFVTYVGTVTGATAGTIVVSAGIMY